MSRYIDADAVKKALKQNTPQYMWGEILTTVNVQPYIDIVRCGECKHREEYPCKVYHDDDWYCADGERKESE